MKQIIRILGGLSLFFGAFVLLVGIGMFMDPDPEYHDSAVPVMLMGLPFVGFGLWTFMESRKQKRREAMLRSAKGLAELNRRIAMPELAKRLGITEAEAQHLVADLVSRGELTGYIDRTTNEFMTEDAVEQQVKIRYCPSCGASLDRTYLQGETIRCPQCGSPIG